MFYRFLDKINRNTYKNVDLKYYAKKYKKLNHNAEVDIECVYIASGIRMEEKKLLQIFAI